MRDEPGFREFTSARSGALRRQALLLTGEPGRAAELAERALADTARRWDRLAGPEAADEHARTVLARAAVRRSPRRSATPSTPPAPGGPVPAAPAPGTRAGEAGSTGRPAGGPSAATRGALAAAAPASRAGAATREAPAGAGRPVGGGTGATTREVPAAAGPADETVPGGETGDGEAVWRALASLPPRRRAVLVLRYDEGLDDTAVAARLGVPPASVAADGEAGLGALRSILRRRGRPEDLLPAALADPARDLPVPAGPAGADRPGGPARPRRRRGPLLAWAAGAAVVAVGAAVLVPVLRSDSAAVPASSSASPALLGWPARGSLAGDEDLLRSALRSWLDGVPAAQRPTETSVLYAGRPDGSRVVLLQGTGSTGLGWVALLGGGADDATPLELLRSEPLGRAAAVLALWGGERRVRLLGPPDPDGGLLVADPGGLRTDPLRRLAVTADGVSEPVSLAGGPLPVVAVRGGPEPGIVGSGRVTEGRLTAPGGEVEIGTSPLPGGGSADVQPAWYDDGRQLARRLGGAVTVAPVGPALATSLGVRGTLRRAEVRAYEVHRGGVSWFGTVVRVGGTPVCVDVAALGAVGAPTRLPVTARRCLPAGARDGVVYVVADAPAASVRVQLQPRRGQRQRAFAVTPATAGAGLPGGGFVAFVRVDTMPTGAGRVEALDGARRPVGRVALAPYAGPRR